jgi:hypothetical protein
MRFFKSKRRMVLLGTALLLAVLLGTTLTAFAHDWPFGDVSASSPFYWNIRRIAVLNISPTGCGGGNFCPKANVTREQMAAYMDRFTKAWTDEDEPYIINMDHRDIANNRPAIVGQSNDGNGVNGISYGAGYADNGVYGETNSTDSGEAGVYGYSTSGANGVRGRNSGSGYGVFGLTATGRGVYGYATSSTGNTYGVYGYTASQDGFPVAGVEYGAFGWDGAWWEPAGFFTGRNGVIGYSDANGYGVIAEHVATSGSGAGLFASTRSPDAYSGRFWTSYGHGVSISTPGGKVGLSVSGGTKNAVVAAEDGARLLYTEESSEVWFTDYGFGQLEDGLAVIKIDPLFAQTVSLEVPYHVFVQVYGDAEVYVGNRTPTAFEVQLRDGDPQVQFSYRLVAKRLGYEDDRLERAPESDNDPNLFPGAEVTTGGAGPSEPGLMDTSPPPVEAQPEVKD